MPNNEQLTRVMNVVVNKIKNDFRTAHYQEEAERKYNKMMMVKNKSAYGHRKQDLLVLFRESNIPCDENMSDRELRALIGRLPGQEDMEALLLQKLHKIYKLFPASSNYMERIVRRLGDPDFRNETVRVAIVKQFLRHTDYETGDFKRSRGKVIELIRKVKGENEINKILNESAGFPDRYERFREAVVSCFDESIFHDYDINYANLNKDDRQKYNLLKLADGLANGKFWMNFGTRRDLYLFAIAFNMRAYPDKEADDYNEMLDIEKNLFFDFYADNLLRSLSVNPGTEEKEPTGEGINYKNFAEIIYLYYLNNESLDAGEKIKRADRAIEDCISRAVGEKAERLADGSMKREDTYVYKENCYSEVMQLHETQLADYIITHYVIPEDVRKSSRIAAASEEITATKIYMELRKKLIGLLADDSRLNDALMPALDIGDTFGDGAGIGIEMQDIRETLGSISEEMGDDRDFVRILTVLDNRLKTDLANDAVLQGTERMTRTRLIALHYLNYVNEMADGTETVHQAGVHSFSGEGKSLSDIYDAFVERVDPDLEEARYQAISPKNLFDMFVIFMLYRYFALI